MTWKVIDAPVGTLACDTYDSVNEQQAKNLFADGYRAIGRYCQDLSASELEVLTSAGLGVFFILEGLAHDTRPTGALGGNIATQGVGRLRGFGVPPGVTVAGDIEGEGRLPSDWIDFCNGEASVTASLGCLPCGYFGEGVGLSGIEIYRTAFTRYWQGGSRVVDRHGFIAEPASGWCVLQGRPFDIKRPDGLAIDVDVLWQDYRGRTITLMVEG